MMLSNSGFTPASPTIKPGEIDLGQRKSPVPVGVADDAGDVRERHGSTSRAERRARHEQVPGGG